MGDKAGTPAHTDQTAGPYHKSHLHLSPANVNQHDPGLDAAARLRTTGSTALRLSLVTIWIYSGAHVSLGTWRAMLTRRSVPELLYPSFSPSSDSPDC